MTDSRGDRRHHPNFRFGEREVELVPPNGVGLRIDDDPVASNAPVRARTGTLAVEILLPKG